MNVVANGFIISHKCIDLKSWLLFLFNFILVVAVVHVHEDFNYTVRQTNDTTLTQVPWISWWYWFSSDRHCTQTQALVQWLRMHKYFKNCHLVNCVTHLTKLVCSCKWIVKITIAIRVLHQHVSYCSFLGTFVPFYFLVSIIQTYTVGLNMFGLYQDFMEYHFWHGGVTLEMKTVHQ